MIYLHPKHLDTLTIIIEYNINFLSSQFVKYDLYLMFLIV